MDNRSTTKFGPVSVNAFMLLPPHSPRAPEGTLQPLPESAVLALGRVDNVSMLLPDEARFL